jgi:hypothetical protein
MSGALSHQEQARLAAVYEDEPWLPQMEQWLADHQAEMGWHNDSSGTLNYRRSDGARVSESWRYGERCRDAIRRAIAAEAARIKAARGEPTSGEGEG